MKHIWLILFTILFIHCSNSSKEIKGIVEQLQTSLDNEDYTYLNSLIAYDRLFEDAYLAMDISYEQSLKMTKILKKQFSLTQSLKRLKEKGSNFKVILNDNEKVVLSIYSTDTLSQLHNYIEFELLKLKKGWKIVDYYNYGYDQQFSENLKNGVVGLYKAEQEGDRTYASFMKLRNATINALKNEDILSAQDYLVRIPEKYQNDKMVKSLAITVSSYFDGQETILLINDYLATFKENNQRVAYLKLMRSIMEQDCSTLNQNIKELWKYTGVDSTSLKYKENCQLEM